VTILRDSDGFPHPLDTLSDVARSMRVAMGGDGYLVTAGLTVHQGDDECWFASLSVNLTGAPLTQVVCFAECDASPSRAADAVLARARFWLSLGLALGEQEAA
jgi:hypothetical protein